MPPRFQNKPVCEKLLTAQTYEFVAPLSAISTMAANQRYLHQAKRRATNTFVIPRPLGGSVSLSSLGESND